MIQRNETICNKVDECLEQMHNLLTGEIDLLKVTKNLHDIRVSAEKMEAALRERKEVMIKHGVEEDYQKRKKNPTSEEGTNKIANISKQQEGVKRDFEFIVKDKGEVMYQKKVHAGVFSVVEHIEDMDEGGNLVGTTQRLLFGQPLVVWFAFNQLQHEMESRKMEVMVAMREAIMNNKLMPKEFRENFVKGLNKYL